MKNKEQIKEELLSTILNLEKTSEIEHLIKNNTIEFSVADTIYRVKKPNYAEQLEIDKYRRIKYLELVSDDTMMFREQWIEKYKTKNIDIKGIEKNIISIQSEIESLLLRLATLSNPSDIEKLRADITQLKSKQIAFSIEKTDLLSCSIEDQLKVQVNSYYTYIVLQKQVNDRWIKVFASFEDFKNSDNSELINKAFYFISYFIYNTL